MEGGAGTFPMDKTNFTQKSGKNKSFTNRAEAYRTTDRFMPGTAQEVVHPGSTAKGQKLYQKLTSHNKQRTESSRTKDLNQEYLYPGPKDFRVTKKSRKPDSIPEKVKSPTIKDSPNKQKDTGHDKWLNFSERDIIASSQYSIEKNTQSANCGFKKNLDQIMKPTKTFNVQTSSIIHPP